MEVCVQCGIETWQKNSSDFEVGQGYEMFLNILRTASRLGQHTNQETLMPVNISIYFMSVCEVRIIG